MLGTTNGDSLKETIISVTVLVEGWHAFEELKLPFLNPWVPHPKTYLTQNMDR